MLASFSARLFGRLLEPRLASFDTLHDQMRKARMDQSLLDYLSLVVFSTVLTFLVSLVASLLIVLVLLPTALGLLIGMLIPVVGTAVTFLLGYSYPSMQANSLKKRIEKGLPFAVFYMTTTASSGSHPLNIFRMLSLRGGVVGEEAIRIYTNVKTLGMDLITALERAAARSPSPEWAELLWGMVSIMTTGGSLEAYLREKTKSAMAQYRRSLNEYAKAIAFYTEIYITLIIVGSLFFIILLAIISPLVGGNTLFLQSFLVFFFIPIVSMGFIMVLKGSSPTE